MGKPALGESTNLNTPPQGLIPDLVRLVEVVHVKATDVGLDLVDAVVAPMVSDIPDDVSMGANEACVEAQLLKALLGQLINTWDIPENLSTHKTQVRRTA